MTGDATRSALLRARPRVPEHVVRRSFPEETVVLNLDTGMYHGLNATAARMFDALEQSSSVAGAVEQLSTELDAAGEVIERDLLDLCRELTRRGLMECDDAGTG